MKRISALSIIAFCLIYNLSAQKATITSDTLKIFGVVENAIIYHSQFLDSFSSQTVSDQILYNHKGEIKDTLKALKGVKLKDLLESVRFKYEKPKELNEFYFVLKAADGYKVVLSWNEIYNNEAGNHYFIITEMNGKKAKDILQRILFLADNDFRSSRRYIKGLNAIEIKRAN